MYPSTPRISIVLLAIAVVAVVAAGVPFDGPGGPDGESEQSTPVPATETPEPSDVDESMFAPLAGAVRYLFGGALGALAIAATIVLYRNLSRPESPEPDPGSGFDRGPLDPGPEDLEQVADSAGRAADRIERGGVIDNEVYRAWKEMTGALHVRNRRARTPGEFAAAAVRAGMDPDDVQALTELFEVARYGTTDPSEAEERRAVDLLRRIESKHGGDAE